MRFSEMIEGLQILAKYEKRGLDAHINGAYHDVIWACTAEVDETDDTDEYGDPISKDSRVSDEDAQRLEELGWFIDGDQECWTHYC